MWLYHFKGVILSIKYTCSACETSFTRKTSALSCAKKHKLKEKRDSERIVFYTSLIHKLFPQTVDSTSFEKLVEYARYIYDNFGLNIDFNSRPNTSRSMYETRATIDPVCINLSTKPPEFLSKINRKNHALHSKDVKCSLFASWFSIAEDIFFHGKKERLEEYIDSVSRAMYSVNLGFEICAMKKYSKNSSGLQDYTLKISMDERKFPLVLSLKEERDTLYKNMASARPKVIASIFKEYEEWAVGNIFSDIEAISLFYEDKAITEKVRELQARQLEIRNTLSTKENSIKNEFSNTFSFSKAYEKEGLLVADFERYNLISANFSDEKRNFTLPSLNDCNAYRVFSERLKDHSWLP